MELEAVSVIENFLLCATVQQVREGKTDQDSMLKVYDISEEEFERANSSYEKYKSIGTMQLYDYIHKREKAKLPDKVVHYVAGTLEVRPSEARKSLVEMEVLKEKKENSARKEFQEKYCVTSYTTSQATIDNIMRDSERTPEEKIKRICELELLEYIRKSDMVEEANQKQHTDRYRVAKEDEEREIG